MAADVVKDSIELQSAVLLKELFFGKILVLAVMLFTKFFVNIADVTC